MKRSGIIFTLFFVFSLSVISCKDNTALILEEDGTQYGLNETFDSVRKGVRLILSYDAQSSSFVGIVENTTNNMIQKVRVEVHLSNGVELGPTTPTDLAPGEMMNISLSAVGEVFNRWSPHAEQG